MSGGPKSLASCIGLPRCPRLAFVPTFSGTISMMLSTALCLARAPASCQLGWWDSQAVCQSWHGFPGGVVGTVDVLAFRKAMLPQEVSVWQGLHMSPRVAPSPRAKLCTYFCWFAQPDRMLVEPCYELPMSITKLRLLLHFRMGSHSLPVEQGRLARPGVARHLRSCTFAPVGP